jgi:hypothetical protein
MPVIIPQGPAPAAKENGTDRIERQLTRNIQNIKGAFGGTSDLKTRFFRIGRRQKISGTLVYIGGQVKNKLIIDAVLYSSASGLATANNYIARFSKNSNGGFVTKSQYIPLGKV